MRYTSKIYGDGQQRRCGEVKTMTKKNCEREITLWCQFTKTVEENNKNWQEKNKKQRTEMKGNH